MDKDIATNVSTNSTRDYCWRLELCPSQGAFLNIELISKKEQYWIQSIKDKRDFPNQVVIASVMVAFTEDDWTI